MDKKKIYIAGKVTGEPVHSTALKFAMAKKKIEARGFEAVNPIEVVGDFRTPWDVAMKLCLKALLDCDAIIMLPDWYESNGARLEHQLATDLKKPVFNFTEVGIVYLMNHQWNS
jgi:nucleoside 2-deoxyribosyltransferase